MNIMSIDCEFNQPSQKTIQIGAAVFNAHTGLLIDKFETYVDPGETINDGTNGHCNIIELTGITDFDVSGAPKILEAFLMLKAFKDRHGAFRNPLVWGSGERNDSDMLWKEAYPTQELRKENPNFMGHRVIDVKCVFQSIQILHNKSVSGGLANICNKRLGIGFEGEAHRALNDAINTFRAWYFMVKKFPGGFK